MALALTNRGSGNHNTSALTFTLSPSGNFAAGSWAVLCVAADNSATGGSTNNITGVTDSIGNTWTPRRTPVFDNGAASAGVQGAIFTTAQNVGALQTGTVITVTFGANTTAKTWTLTEATKGAGEVISFVTGGDKSAGATGTALTMGASATVAVGDAIVAAFFVEAGTTQSLSAADTDTTNGSWTTNQYNEIGSTTSGSVIVSQGKIQTTTPSTQTYDVTLGISSDYHGSWIVLHAQADATVLAPDPVTTTAAIPASTLDKIMALAPSPIAVATAVPDATLIVDQSVAPEPVSVSLVVPVPTLGLSIALDPVAIPVSLTVPTPTVEMAYTIEPAAVSVASAVPAPTFDTPLDLSPDPVSIATLIPAPAFDTLLDLAPDPVVTLTAVPPPMIEQEGGVIEIQPDPVTVVLDVPVSVLVAILDLAPDPVTSSTGVPASILDHDRGITPTPVTTNLTVPAPVLAWIMSLAPTPVAVTTAVPIPIVTGGGAPDLPDIIITASEAGITFTTTRVEIEVEE